ncbi:MAG TPA: signal peptidase I [Bryobacteraceae bacterium]|nr:signal peptidase I [Bryobacteraceae bacterium]
MEAANPHAPSLWPTATQALLTTVIIAIFVVTFVVQAFQIPSPSMENTLLVGDYLLVDKLRYGGGSFDEIMPYQKVQRGDVVVFHYPIDPSQHFVKRVIGVPGDRLRMIDRTVYINGSPLSEPYVRYISSQRDAFRDNFPQLNLPVPGLEGRWWLQMRKLVEDGELIVPDGYYFVMGDNRDDSQDSRYWGFVPRDNIVGRPLVIYWSVKSSSDESATAPSPGDRLLHLAYAVTHVVQVTRWNRTLRLVY